MIKSAQTTNILVEDDAPGCPIPGRTRHIQALCGVTHDRLITFAVDKVDGDLSIALILDGEFVDGPCLTKETALALCATLKQELEKL